MPSVSGMWSRTLLLCLSLSTGVQRAQLQDSLEFPICFRYSAIFFRLALKFPCCWMGIRDFLQLYPFLTLRVWYLPPLWMTFVLASSASWSSAKQQHENDTIFDYFRNACGGVDNSSKANLILVNFTLFGAWQGLEQWQRPRSNLQSHNISLCSSHIWKAHLRK